MRKVALFAGVVQLLFGMFTVAPQMFGTEFFSAPGQTAYRTFTVITCLVLAIFFLGILTTPVPNVGGAMRIASFVAASALIVENFRSAIGSIRAAAVAGSDSWLWRYHPLRHFAYILGLAIPTLGEITLVVFLLVVFARSLGRQDLKQDLEDRTGFLRLASFGVAAVFVIALVGTFFAVILAPRPYSVWVVRLLFRFATLASLVAFFFVTGVNQQRGES
jgi:hypothetical protein